MGLALGCYILVLVPKKAVEATAENSPEDSPGVDGMAQGEKHYSK